MLEEFGKFIAAVLILITKPVETDEDYRRLYRLYKANKKAQELLEAEWFDLEVELAPLPHHAEILLRSSSKNVKSWSHYFYKNPTPTKSKGVKTIPSLATDQIRIRLLHSI